MNLEAGETNMGIWKLHGGNRLTGTTYIQGAKNAVLPILSGALLSPGVTTLKNVPQLRDVDHTLKILSCLGCTVVREGDTVIIDGKQARFAPVPPELMTHMRSSVLFLGAMLARFGKGCVSMPGGCMLGPRPVDLHLQALEALGAKLTLSDDTISCEAARLKGTRIVFPMPSVGATENAMLAACGAEGETVLQNAAREPEIVDLQNFLVSLGAEITGAGTGTIVIRGMCPVDRAEHSIVPDRIAAATILCAGAACGGDITVHNVVPAHIDTITEALRQMGCRVTEGTDYIRLVSDGRLLSPGLIETKPYPGFPTDAQPLLLAACLKARGTAEFRETIFSGRLRHTKQLQKLGGNIRVDDRTAYVTGVPRLNGTTVQATDLRGGAALVIAGLMAEGETELIDRDHITRGYDRLDESLRALGGDVTYTE